MDNATRKELLYKARAAGYPGSILDVFANYDQGKDVIAEFQQQQQMQQMQQQQMPAQSMQPQQQMQTPQMPVVPSSPTPAPNFTPPQPPQPIGVQSQDSPMGIVSGQSGPNQGRAIFKTGGFKYEEGGPTNKKDPKQGGSLATAQKGIPYSYYNPDTQSYNRPPEDKNQFVPWDKYMPAFQTAPVEIVAKRPTEEQIQKNQYLDDRQKFIPDKTSWYESFNPYNWGVNDYSDYSSFNSAFRNARESGEKEFMFNEERYNTNLVDKKHSNDYWDQKNFLREYYKNEPFKPLAYYDSTKFAQDLVKDKYGTTWLDYYNKRKDEKKSLSYDDKRYSEIQDSLNMLDEDDYLRNPTKRPELNQYIKSNLGKTELANLEEPYYFSITNNPIVEKDGTTLGFVNPKDKKLFVSTDRGSNLNTTYVHELSHKGDQGDVTMRTPKVDYKTLNAFNQGRLDQGMVNYLVNPTEIEARKMSTLYYFKKNGLPYQTGKITSKQVFDLNSDIIANPKKYPSDLVQLFQLFDGQTGKLIKYFNNDFSKKEGDKKLGGPVCYTCVGRKRRV